MNHTMYVTVAEFLENGGELKLGRRIYCYGAECGIYGGIYDNNDFIIVKEANRSFSILKTQCYISVPCTPQYI